MKSMVGLILAGGYLLLIAALLVAWAILQRFDAYFPLWQDVGGALFVFTLPWSILWFFTVSVERPLLTDIAYVAIHLFGGLINAAIIYFVCALISYWVKKLVRRDTP